MSEAPKKLEAADIQAMFDRSPFIGFLGLKVLGLDHAASTFSARMPLRPELERRAGTKQFHGGPVASFIDTVGDFAIGMLVGGGVPTINLRIDYLRPSVGDYIDATAVVRRAGKSTAVVDIDVFGPDGKLVAVGRGTYSPQTA
ncbi:MAG: PaaI family thioesterase [Proteobacteria bacterium]|nr:PaaI family thioesterase [Pseudomonadota bacterium]